MKIDARRQPIFRPKSLSVPVNTIHTNNIVEFEKNFENTHKVFKN